MLPKVLYELLPYLYLSLGASSGVFINSVIVLMGSFLLISTGLLILTLRITHRRKRRRLRSQA